MSDRRGLLSMSILQMVNEAVEFAVARHTESVQRQIDEMQDRLDQMEDRLTLIMTPNNAPGGTNGGGNTGKKSSSSGMLRSGLLSVKKRNKSSSHTEARAIFASSPSGLVSTRERGSSAPLSNDLSVSTPATSSTTFSGTSTPPIIINPAPSSSSTSSFSSFSPSITQSSISGSSSALTLSASPSGSLRQASPTLEQAAAAMKHHIIPPGRVEEPNPLLNVFEDIDAYHFETGATVYKSISGSPSESLTLIDPHLDENFYLANFFGLPQTHYYLPDDPSSALGPVLITVREPATKNDTPIGLIRTQHADIRIKLTESGKKKRIAELLSLSNLPPDIKLTPIDAEKLTRRLISLEHESINEHRQYKFGILLAHDDQTEDEMFANDTTPEFEEFLAFLGEKIELQGWKKYRAGLDTKSGTTGTYSVYQRYQNHQVMFHVSTLLPKVPNCAQQLERKRHLGNDVCLIVFHDGTKPFKPSLIHSHFNYVFIVVRPVPRSEVPEQTPADTSGSGSYSESGVEYPPNLPNVIYYKIATAVKRAAPAHKITPYLPSPPIVPNNAKTLEFLLVKLINAERAVMHATEFQQRISRTRRLLLGSIIEDYCK